MKKPIAYLMMFAVLFTATAEAKKKGRGKGPKVDKEKVERERKREDEKRDVDGVLEQKDVNKDSQVTLQEWLIGESDEARATQDFTEGDKNRDRHLSRSEIGAMLGH